MEHSQNASYCLETQTLFDLSHFNKPRSGSLLHQFPEPVSFLTLRVLTLMPIFILFGVLLFRSLPITWTSIPKAASSPQKMKDPPQVPYSVPLIGNIVTYLLDASQLALSIRQRFGPSSVVRLKFLKMDVFVVSGAEYLNAVWKNTKGMTSTNGINIALHYMFNTSKRDMLFFEADDSGITHAPHPQSSIRPEDRVFYLMHKATVDCLAGSHLVTAAQKFHDALERRIQAVPVYDDWIEMDDLFQFLRPLISYSTVEAMCGAKFLKTFPDFIDNFWNFNGRMPRLLQGWPRWMMPKAWQERDRCISIMKQWRKMSHEENFDGNAMIPQRWSCFSKMQGLSEDGVACSDLGILWGMNSNSMPATFWLFWNMMRDQTLLARATSEVSACRSAHTTNRLAFDTTKLCNQPLLQSSYAETLRMYVAVYIIRQPVHQDALILDYKVPKDKMIAVSSSMAHMDERNWNLGTKNEHPVDKFWADRFLFYDSNKSKPSCDLSTGSTKPAINDSGPTSSVANSPNPSPSKPNFSLNSYSGAWIPFGGGIHQCPGRHWVKLQMLLSFAMINAAFEIKLLDQEGELKVDMAKYGLGALQPAEKARFMIKRKKTAD